MASNPLVYDTLADLLSVANIVLFAGVAIVSIHDFYKCSKIEGYGWCWIKIATGVVAAYYSLLYVWILFADPSSYNQMYFGRIFVRPAQTILAGLILSSSIIRSKNGGTFFDGSGIKTMVCRLRRAKEPGKNNEC